MNHGWLLVAHQCLRTQPQTFMKGKKVAILAMPFNTTPE